MKKISNFQNQIIGPLIVTIKPKTQQYADYLDSLILYTLKTSFICTNDHDLKILNNLNKQLHTNIKILMYQNDVGFDSGTQNNTPHQSTSTNYRQMYGINDEYLRNNGLNCYMNEVYDAPLIIQNILNDYFKLDCVGVFDENLTQQQMNAVLSQKNDGKLMRIYTPNEEYQVKLSKYSLNTSITTIYVKKSSFFNLSNDTLELQSP